MKATGIVAEFNPLHNGHVYMLKEAIVKGGDDAVVIAMSGNYVQRGEPAIFDKWTRAKAALAGGADLIIEIPTVYSIGNAAQFASAGVKLLESLGCVRHLAFGSEGADIDGMQKLAYFIKSRRSEIDKKIRAYSSEGLSYPAAREKAVNDLMAEQNESVDAVSAMPVCSNDILALEYLMALESAEPVCIKRRGTGYNDKIDKGAEHQSATAIRECIKLYKAGFGAGNNTALDLIKPYIPECTLKMIEDEPVCSDDKWDDILKYAVINMSADEIENCPSAGDGLGYLIKKAALECDSKEDIISYCKSKRYTYSRLSRLCMQIILGIKRDMHSSSAEYVRVLGFNGKGRDLLSHIKKNELCSLPIITNINKEQAELSAAGKRIMEAEIHSTDIYNMVMGRKASEYSEKVRGAIIE